MMPAAKFGEDNGPQISLCEIMESIQGEGLLIGCPQVFVRLAGCNLCCYYCDTQESRVAAPVSYNIYPLTGQRGQALSRSNPVDPAALAKLIQQHFTAKWISFTGGEPLLGAAFIKAAAGLLKPRGYRFLLETNGTLPEALDICLEKMDCISMDWKLFSANQHDFSREHLQFLARARAKFCYVKIVVAGDSDDDEVKHALGSISYVDRKIPVVLQMASPQPNCPAPTMAKMLRLLQAGIKDLDEVRIMPQMHRLMGIT